MKMEITRNVILDLMPLFSAGEANSDTAALIQEFLKNDPELARLAQRTNKTNLAEVPVPISKEAEMDAYVKATQRMIYRMLAMSALIIASVLGLIVFVMYFVFGMR